MFYKDTTSMSVADKVAQYGVQGLNNLEFIKSVLMLTSKSEKTIDELARKVEPMVLNGRTDVHDYEEAGCKAEVAIVFAGMAEYIKRAKGGTDIADNPLTIYERVKHFAYADVEKFIVVYMDGANQIKEIREISSGILNGSVIHAREVFAPAIAGRYCKIALVHNHPSEKAEPSDDDITTTKRLQDAGNILGIPVLDHLIITKNGYFSFVEYRMIK